MSNMHAEFSIKKKICTLTDCDVMTLKKVIQPVHAILAKDDVPLYKVLSFFLLLLNLFSSPSDLLCLRSFRSKYNA